MTLAAVVSALVLALVHVVTPMLHFLHGTPRSVWLSIAGGVSVAYVFVHLLPELAEGQRHVSAALGGEGAAGSALAFAERHVYLVALAGLAVFYGLERLAKRSRRQESGQPVGTGRSSAEREAVGEEGADAPPASPGVFWIHMASFAVYNVLVGYLLLHGERESVATLALFATAMALHFVVTDFGLDAHHEHRYKGVGRWILAAAVLLGLGLAMLTALPEAAIAVLIAFLAGGIILNVLKEEVPSERQSRFWAFAAGMAGYAALLLAV